jgi:hypothetical protein
MEMRENECGCRSLELLAFACSREAVKFYDCNFKSFREKTI